MEQGAGIIVPAVGKEISVMLEDNSLKNIHLTRRVTELRKDYFRAVPEICIERPLLITQFSLKHNFFSQKRISILDKANVYGHVLKHREAIVRHDRACEKNTDKKLKVRVSFCP